MSMKPRTMIKNIMDVVNCHKTLEPKTCVISVDASHNDFSLRQSARMIYFVSLSQHFILDKFTPITVQNYTED